MKRIAFFTSLALVLCLTAAFSPAFASSDFGGGDGTETSPYLISTAQHLRTLAEDVNSGISYEGVYFQMTNDIDLEGNPENQWEPIGHCYNLGSLQYPSVVNPFAGSFDGMDYIISGLYMDDTIAQTTNSGALFGLNTGIIQNLGVSGFISMKNGWVSSVVVDNYGIIRNCYNAGTELYSLYVIGGVVAYTDTESMSSELQGVGLVEGCYNEIPITITYSNDDKLDSAIIGGVVASVTGVIKDCYNTGDITLVGNSYCVGGVVGESGSMLMENCYNLGNISALPLNYEGEYQNKDTGGICGVGNYGTFKNCYNRGTITGELSVGGLIGCASDETIENCYNAGLALTVRPEWFDANPLSGTTADNAIHSYYDNEICPIERTCEEPYGRPTASFKSGEIAYLLQKDQEEQVWGQSLPGDDCPILTDDPAKRVHQVTFVSESTPIHTVYTNGTVEKPADPVSETSGKEFLFWSTEEGESAPEFDFQEPVSADTTLYAHWKTVSTPTPKPTPSGGSTSSSGGSSSSRKDKPAASETAEPPPAEPEPTEPPAEETDPLFVPVAEQFADVTSGDWFEEAIQYACDNGMMNGMAETVFAPQVPVSRAMMVTVLYRLEGEPSVTSAGFSDVAEGSYYANAVAWSAAKGLVNGFEDKTFRPDGDMTREQLATLLYRYAAMKGLDVTQAADLSGYIDLNQISPYALPAMKWVNAAGLLTGTDWGGLAPQTETTRAEAAAILMRFCENVMK